MINPDISRLERWVIDAERSGQYDISSDFGPGVSVEYLDDIDRRISADAGMGGFQMLDALRIFYRRTNGFSLWWRSRVDPDGPRAAAGVAVITDIERLYEPPVCTAIPYSSLYDEPRIFDAAGPGARVDAHFSRGKAEPALYYYSERFGAPRLLSLSIIEYLDRLVICRAMVGWQEFFVVGRASAWDQAWAHRFLKRLTRLCPDEDVTVFESAVVMHGR